jgi:hypothetical protein
MPAEYSTRWEYKTVSVFDTSNTVSPDRLTDILNNEGKDGWEFVSFYGLYAIMKKPVTHVVNVLPIKESMLNYEGLH